MRPLRILTLAFLLFTLTAAAQTDRRIEEQKRVIAALEKRIATEEQEISKIQKGRTATEERVRRLARQIDSRNQLLDETEKQARLLRGEIARTDSVAGNLSAKLERDRAQYGEMVREAYRNYKHNNYLTYIFSSRDFTDVARKITALREVASLRERKLRDIEALTAEVRTEKGTDADGNAVELKYDPNGKPVAFVFKTVADQYGRFSYFKVISGKVTADMVLQNTNTETQEKMGHIYIVKGKKNIEVKEIGCGDIGAVSKLNNTRTGDTLCDPSLNIRLDGIQYAEPCYSQAVSAKTKGGEEKIAAGLTRLKDEDPTFTIVNNAETKQMVISGAGDIHIDVLCSKLKSKFGVEVELSDPKVAYRETIRKKVTLIEGNHKKQSGGHGQYGNVKMNFEPIEGDGFEFAEEVFGGSVPKNFFPAVEKGIREAMEHGVLAGFPMVGLKATLVDGKYHPVDSNELSFKMAARLAYKAGIPQANPVILEPVGSLKVYIPDSYMGDIIGDLNKRRGRVMGMNPAEDGLQLVEAEVPMSEVADYAITLRSMTQGRGSFSVKFERYEPVPAEVQEKIIADAKFEDDDE